MMKKGRRAASRYRSGHPADGSALLGVTGASTAAPIMLELMAKVFPEQMRSPEWQTKIRA